MFDDLKIKSYKKENKNLSRVFFSCHKDDFDKYFTDIVSDIINIQDCNIYYLEKSDKDINDYNNSLYLSDLNKMNLFVFPISFKFLTNDSISRNIDFSFAKNNNIPILPIFVEPNISGLFNDKCGRLQALDINECVNGEKQFKNKLNNFIKSVLSTDDIFSKIKHSFDKYIFLSYRKNDIDYVQEVMSIIHSFDFMRDVAIWYDWSLTPGIEFDNEIRSILEKSDLVSFVVTPNILNKDNYIYKYEYPYSIKLNKNILPIEVISTDKMALKQFYNKFDLVINKDDKEKLSNELLAILFNNSYKPNNEYEHLFYIGLAYLNAIDVERDIKKGIDLIIESATNNYVPAIKELVDMYSNGIRTTVDYKKSIEWQNKLLAIDDGSLDYYVRLNNLAHLYSLDGNFLKAIELNEECYKLRLNAKGKYDKETLISLMNLASNYGKYGNFDKALNLMCEAYSSSQKIYGCEDNLTVFALGNLATCYKDAGDYYKAKALYEENHRLNIRIYGEKHPRTLFSLFMLGTIYDELKEYDKSLELNKKCYELRCKVLGEKHPDTLRSLDNLSVSYSHFSDYKKTLDLNKKCYELKKEILGEGHPDTLLSLNNLGSCYRDVGDFSNAIYCYRKCIKLESKIYPEYHLSLINTLSNLATAYVDANKYYEAFELLKGCYAIIVQNYGENHPRALDLKRNLFSVYYLAKEKNIKINLNV